jgi:hypothetical protein
MACLEDGNIDFGFPMTAAEYNDLLSRNGRTEPVVAVVQRYAGQHRDEFGGLYIDQTRGGIVTALWTDHLEQHDAAIRSELPADAPILTRQVRWTEAVLRDLQGRVSSEIDWMLTIPALAQGVGVDVARNVVLVEISSVDPVAERVIKAHYGVDPAMIEVQSDGTGVALLPSGTVRGRVVDKTGKPVSAEIAAELLIDGRAEVGYCGGGDVGYGVDQAGRFEIPCKVDVYRMWHWCPLSERLARRNRSAS